MRRPPRTSILRSLALALCLSGVAVSSVGCQRAPEARPVEVEIGVDGMVCESCVQAIEQTVGMMDGVASVEVDLESTRAVIEFDERKVSRAEVEAAIEKLGYRVTEAPARDG